MVPKEPLGYRGPLSAWPGSLSICRGPSESVKGLHEATEGAPEATKRGPLRQPKGPLSCQWFPEHVTVPSERLKGSSELPRGT